MPRYTTSFRTSGQSTVEAAVVLPTLLLLLAMLVQPVCIAYTETVMRGAAAEGARLLATSPSEERCRAFVLRRLGAVPETSLFHVGGSGDWQIDLTRSDGGGSTSVEVSGHVRPLPFFGALARAWGERDEQGVLLKVCVTERLRPSWLEGSYADWVGVWG